jgi:opacity protein-like surface antigen
MIKKSLLALVVAGSMVAGAQAASPNGYLFANIGQSDADKPSYINEIDADARAFASELELQYRSSYDSKDTAYKIGAGVQLNPYVGLEFQYINLGEAVFKFSFSDGELTAGGKANAETDGYGANLVGTLPLDRFKLFGKVGYHKLKTDAKASALGETIERASANEWVTSFGVGAAFALTPAVEIVGEFERFRDVADEYDVDLASVGLRYNF